MSVTHNPLDLEVLKVVSIYLSTKSQTTKEQNESGKREQLIKKEQFYYI